MASNTLIKIVMNMKNLFFILLVLLFCSCNSNRLSDPIVGVWQIGDRENDFLIFTKEGKFYNESSSILRKYSVKGNVLYLDEKEHFEIQYENESSMQLKDNDDNVIYTLIRLEERKFFGKWVVEQSTINGEDYYELDNQIFTFSCMNDFEQGNEKGKYEYNPEKEVLILKKEYINDYCKIEQCTDDKLVLVVNIPGWNDIQKLKIELKKMTNLNEDDFPYSIKQVMEYVSELTINGENPMRLDKDEQFAKHIREVTESIRIADSLANSDVRNSLEYEY